jgi:hypothetical protein
MRTLLCAAALVAAVFVPADARAQACAGRAALIAALARDWGEAPVFRGLDAAGRLVELLVAPSGSWSLVLTVPAGTACLVGAGADAAVEPPRRAAGAPS